LVLIGSAEPVYVRDLIVYVGLRGNGVQLPDRCSWGQEQVVEYALISADLSDGCFTDKLRRVVRRCARDCMRRIGRTWPRLGLNATGVAAASRDDGDKTDG
jgi:hypothetical protein